MKLPPGGVVTGGADIAPRDESVTSLEEQRWLHCASCRQRITPERMRIEVDGAHEHAFMNPSAIRFRVGCFAMAPGCVPEGERSTVWSFFPGRAWQIALCMGCGAHLGWSFHREQSLPFHGLVCDRLVG